MEQRRHHGASRGGGGGHHHNGNHHHNNKRFGGRSQRGGHHHGSSNSGHRGSYWFKGEGYNDHDAVSIDEQVVGIQGFLTPDQPGFTGLVKQRFSDFMVHEIASNGQVVTLTTLAKKQKPLQTQVFERLLGFAFGPAKDKDKDAPPNSSECPADVNAAVRELVQKVQRLAAVQSKLGAQALETQNMAKLILKVTSELGQKKGKEFKEFLEAVRARKLAELQAKADASAKRSTNAASATTTTTTTTYSASTEPEEEMVFYIGGLQEKSDRVVLHESMRTYGKTLIVADTITAEDNTQVIRIRRVLPGPKKGDRRDWPTDRPDYLQFVVYKRNKDIMSVINQIGSMLKVSSSIFSHADAKDKRGVTTQLVTAYRVPKERAQNVMRVHPNKTLDDNQYLIGDLKYVHTKLTPGDCMGNAFSMVIRSLPAEDELSEAAISTAVQKWAARGFINFVGLQRFGSSSTPYHVIGRAILRKDFTLAVRLLLRPQEGEASKVRQARDHFRQHKDVAAALRMFPPFLVPERAVLEGLLQNGIDANELAFRNVPAHLRVAYVESYQNYVWNQMASLRISSLSSDEVAIGDLVMQRTTGAPALRSNSANLVVVTEENKAAYSIEDVVLPLPGHSIVHPANEIGEAYQKLLKTDGVDLASWLGLGTPTHQYELSGTYRHVIRKPTHVSHEVKHYYDPTHSLLLNDADVLQNRKSVPAEPEPVAKEDGSVPKAQRALVLHFRLAYGSDATIAVRELMKQNSSIHVQWQLSEQGEGAHTQSAPVAKTENGANASKKRPAPAHSKETKIVALKKTQVAIGRPGFSLGKS